MNVKWVSNNIRPQESGILIIKEEKKESIYATLSIPSDWGEGWELHKLTWDEHKSKTTATDIYHVNLNGNDSTCDCMGFLQWQKPCKHIKALQQMKEEKT